MEVRLPGSDCSAVFSFSTFKDSLFSFKIQISVKETFSPSPAMPGAVNYLLNSELHTPS